MKINMVEPGCWDDKLMDEDFESILNILDFPLESFGDDGLGLGGDCDPSLYQVLGPIPSDALMAFPPLPRGDIANSCLNAVSNCNVLKEFPKAKGTGLFQTQSPVSVLETSSSCSGGKSVTFNFGTKRRRSKRARSTTSNPWLLMAPLSCTAKKIFDAKKGKEKKRKLSQESGAMRSSSGQKCTHCEITKTPQWREGPLGPKTLCNACGVRYRSGRLFPEYRPAASPTFVPSLHSNSHRKVIEIRKQAVEGSQGDPPERSFARPYNVTEPDTCSSELLFV